MAVIKAQAVGRDGFNTSTDLLIGLLRQYTQFTTRPTEARFYTDADNETAFGGTGFKYVIKNGRLADVLAGTITSITVQVKGVETVAISDIGLSAARVFDFYKAGADVKEIEYLLGGADRITGTKVGDYIDGFRGNDTLNGGGGQDVLVGGQGDDVLTGGAGRDQFVFVGVARKLGTDVITDYHRSQGDTIDLSVFTMSFVGTDRFSGDHPELRFHKTAGKTYVEADTDGDGVKDFTIVLKGSFALTAHDFLL
ncbi:calcium-binding protein [Rhizobium sp. CC-YZS058]|uniref:calcium-binding protein n=1 Tax=Rhizobium sp. CC-YZS058 TaxID=3042153 RepID=UPI002B053184|nr:calcium-binding protein [Rhizobium sp. CC-YZS058]MEA3535186.1 calcium-binding protein [Rhizobium sp. CC-YZS058]